jgi:hypothetical protein
MQIAHVVVSVTGAEPERRPGVLPSTSSTSWSRRPYA